MKVALRPKYVYVASSWRNTTQPIVVERLRAAGVECYDFKNPPEGTGFSWREVKTVPSEPQTWCIHCGGEISWWPAWEVYYHTATKLYGCGDAHIAAPGGVRPKGSDWEQVDEYLRMIEHPRAIEGFTSDFDAMQRADTFVMVLPCGKSAHLELGWAVGAGKRTVILLEDPVEPELMYRMVGHLATSIDDLLDVLGVWPPSPDGGDL